MSFPFNVRQYCQLECLLVCSSGCGEGPLAGGQRPGAEGHIHDGFSERQIRPLRNVQSGQPIFQKQDHQREFEPHME